MCDQRPTGNTAGAEYVKVLGNQNDSCMACVRAYLCVCVACVRARECMGSDVDIKNVIILLI